MSLRNIKGIGYDLDGTIISTVHLHEHAWTEAARLMGMSLPHGFLYQQRGMPTEAAAALVFDDTEKIATFVSHKNEFVSSHRGKLLVFPGFFETIQELVRRGIQIAICTSGDKAFIQQIGSMDNRFEMFTDKVVYREMYIEGKPSGEPLLVTWKSMGLESQECLYIGDAYNDFLAAQNAGSHFAYFCPIKEARDPRIPNEVLTITNHKEIVSLILVAA